MIFGRRFLGYKQLQRRDMTWLLGMFSELVIGEKSTKTNTDERNRSGVSRHARAHLVKKEYDDVIR